MAKRGVFVSKDRYPYFEEVYVEFDWFGGFALSQKRKCILGLHLNFNEFYDDKVLEVSSNSLDPLGNKLSAMNLRKRVISDNKVTSVESAFQSSRIYTNKSTGETLGPFTEYRYSDGFSSKKEVKALVSKGDFHSYNYRFDGMDFPAPDFHISLFYDYLYINALLEDENKCVFNELIRSNYTAFTDLATKSLNCQARSCAIFISLYKLGLLDKVKDYNSFMELFRVNLNSDTYSYNNSYEGVQLLKNNGEVTLISDTIYKVFEKDYISEYYNRYYGHLPNVKSAKYNDVKWLSVSEAFEGVDNCAFYKAVVNGDVVGFFVKTFSGGFYISYDMGYELGLLNIDCKILNLIEVDTYYISQYELDNKIMFPQINESHTNILKWLKGYISN